MNPRKGRAKRPNEKPKPAGLDAHKCIYCLELKHRDEFNREHIVPVAFGSFTNSPVLRETVCAKCNAYFSQHLDIILARASPEGLERYRWGVRSPEHHARFDQGSVKLTARVEGDYRDTLLALDHDPSAGELTARMRPQVGFAVKGTDGFKYFTLDELASEAWKSDPEIDPRRGVRMVECDFEEVKKMLESHGIRYKEWRPMIPPANQKEIVVQQEYGFPSGFLRAIAKVAFNHMSFVNGPEFALRSEFDSTRRFIRYGREPFLPAVMLHEGDIYQIRSAAAAESERAIVHIVTTTEPLNAEVILGQVTLFNVTQYDVTLAHSRVSGFKRGGHLFNLRTKKAYVLVPRKR